MTLETEVQSLRQVPMFRDIDPARLKLLAREHGGILRVELLGFRECRLGGIEVERVQAHAAVGCEPVGAAAAELEGSLVALHREPRIAALQLRLRERAPGRGVSGISVPPGDGLALQRAPVGCGLVQIRVKAIDRRGARREHR